MLVRPKELTTTTASAATFVTAPGASTYRKHLSKAVAMLALPDIHALDQLQCDVGIGLSVSSNCNTKSRLQGGRVFLSPVVEGVLVTFASLLTLGCS